MNGATAPARWPAELLEKEYARFAAYTQANLLVQTDAYAAVIPYLYLAVAGEHGESEAAAHRWRPFVEHLRALHRDGQSARARTEYALLTGMLAYSSSHQDSLNNFLKETRRII